MDPHSSSAPDATLVARMAQGDLDAARQLCQRYGTPVYTLAYNVLVDPADATEVVADTFERAWQTARYFDGAQGSVLGWLTEIARILADDTLRARYEGSSHPPGNR